MHKLLLAALAATTVLGAGTIRADAMSLGGSAGIQLAQGQPGMAEQVRRVCRQFFDRDDGVWRTRCFDDDDDDYRRYRFRDRDYDRDRDRDRDRFRDRDRDRDRDCDRVGPVIVCH
jgi:hypothetical protein